MFRFIIPNIAEKSFANESCHTAECELFHISFWSNITFCVAAVELFSASVKKLNLHIFVAVEIFSDMYSKSLKEYFHKV